MSIHYHDRDLVPFNKTNLFFSIFFFFFVFFRFLKSKVTILQQELDLSHQENTKSADALAKAIEQQKKFEATRCQATNQINSLNAQIQKLQQNESNLSIKLKVCIPAQPFETCRKKT